MSISTSPVDPSGFLKVLQTTIYKAGNKTFNFNKQQDAIEILQHIIEDMSKDSPTASLSVSVTTKTTTTCNTCLLSDISETKTLYIEVPVQKSIQLALTKYLEATEGEGFCACCREVTSNIRDQCLTETSTYLIVHQKRFCTDIGIAGKNCTLVE